MTTRINQVEAARASISTHQKSVMAIVRQVFSLAETAVWTILRIAHRVLVIFDDSLTMAWLINLPWIAAGLYWLILDRSVNPRDVNGNENDMGFGQLIPIFLLASTVFVFQEALNGMSQ